jgi:glutamine synthetase
VAVGLGAGAAVTGERRLADPAPNPYLLVSGPLATAAHGIDADIDSGGPFEEDIGGFDPATASAMQARRLSCLANDVLVDAFDSRLLSRLVDGRRVEADDFRAQVTPWEVEHYLDEA